MIYVALLTSHATSQEFDLRASRDWRPVCLFEEAVAVQPVLLKFRGTIANASKASKLLGRCCLDKGTLEMYALRLTVKAHTQEPWSYKYICVKIAVEIYAVSSTGIPFIYKCCCLILRQF